MLAYPARGFPSSGLRIALPFRLPWLLWVVILLWDLLVVSRAGFCLIKRR